MKPTKIIPTAVSRENWVSSEMMSTIMRWQSQHNQKRKRKRRGISLFTSFYIIRRGFSSMRNIHSFISTRNWVWLKIVLIYVKVLITNIICLYCLCPETLKRMVRGCVTKFVTLAHRFFDKRKALFRNVVTFELHTFDPKFLHFFDTFQITRSVDVH